MPPIQAVDFERALCVLAFHLALVAGFFFTPVTPRALAVMIPMYALTGFGITAGNHRYFSHRSYKTSRTFQFLLAILSTMNGLQFGVLWWAANHRHHHRFADQAEDPHSPERMGFWSSHMGWIFDKANSPTRYDLIPDLAKYAELQWLNRHHLAPFFLLSALILWFGGWPAVYWGVIYVSVVVFHLTNVVNSLGHRWGSRRYATTDSSRNNWVIALLTMGEGWHNNHHHYMSSVRQGFFWWEIDTTWYVLLALSKIGIVWDLHSPPPRLLAVQG